MGNYNIVYGNELYHYGVKGMKWGKSIFGGASKIKKSASDAIAKTKASVGNKLRKPFAPTVDEGSNGRSNIVPSSRNQHLYDKGRVHEGAVDLMPQTSKYYALGALQKERAQKDIQKVAPDAIIYDTSYDKGTLTVKAFSSKLGVDITKTSYDSAVEKAEEASNKIEDFIKTSKMLSRATDEVTNFGTTPIGYQTSRRSMDKKKKKQQKASVKVSRSEDLSRFGRME